MSLITYDLMGNKHDKVQTAIERLRAFEPEDGYYLAFSGGKVLAKFCPPTSKKGRKLNVRLVLDRATGNGAAYSRR